MTEEPDECSSDGDDSEDVTEDGWSGVRPVEDGDNLEQKFLLTMMKNQRGQPKYFVGRCIGDDNLGEIDMKFMRAYGNGVDFVWPDIPDISVMDRSGVIGILDPIEKRRGVMTFRDAQPHQWK